MPSNIRKKVSNSESNRSTYLFEWKKTPELAQQHLLDFLSPSIALKIIVTCKQNMKLYGKYIIKRFQKEKFKYKSIQIANDEYNLVLHQDGSLYAWGNNDGGQLGLGNNNNKNIPQPIDLNYLDNKTIQSIHTGLQHTLALMEDNSLYAWGRNSDGQLGLGHTDNQTTPQLINPSHFQNEKIKSIYIGIECGLALTENDSLYAWGWNKFGQLGLGHNTNQNTPQLIDPVNFDNQAIQSIHIGVFHTLALMNDGSLYAWGLNDKGQLGLGHNRRQNTPQKIEGRLEKAFRLGHENISSLSMFKNKPPEEKKAMQNCFLSKHVFIKGEMNEVPTQSTLPGRQS